MTSTVSNSMENAALGAAVATPVMSVISQNATVISVICTVIFGFIYACCAIWNAHSNHKRNKVSEGVILENIIESMIKKGDPIDLIKIVESHKDKL